MIDIIIPSSSQDTLFPNNETPKVPNNNMSRSSPYCPFITFFFFH